MNNISYEDRKKTYEAALERWGPELQSRKSIEEIGEFLVEWARLDGPREDVEAFADEIADVTIMLEQLRIIHDINDLVCEHMDQKILRLQERLAKPESIEERALKFFRNEVKSLLIAPSLNGCEMTEEWAEMLAVFNFAIDAINQTISWRKRPKGIEKREASEK